MKKTIIVIIILLIAGVAFWMFKSKINMPATNTINTTTEQKVSDTDISTINKDIDLIDVGDSDQEFNDVNKDLQGL